MDALTRGLELYNAGRFAEARDRFQAARDADPGAPEPAYFLAHVLVSLGRPQDALRAFAALIAAHPGHLPAYSGLANLILHHGPFELEHRTLKKILTLSPRDAQSRLRLADVVEVCAQAFRASGDVAAAEAALRKAMSLDPSREKNRAELIALLRMRAQACLAENALAKSESILREALEVSPGDGPTAVLLSDVLRLRARQQLASRRPDGSEKSLRAALALRPSDTKARHRLLELLRAQARAARKSASSRKAEKAVRRGLAFAPKDTQLRGWLLELLRARAKTERDLRRLLEFAPEDAATRARLSTLLSARAERLREKAKTALLARKLSSAERLFRSALTFVPEDATLWLGLAAVESAKGRKSAEKRHLERAITLDRGRLPPAERFMALMKLRRHAAAVVTAEKILDASPGLREIRGFWDPWEWDERVSREEHLRELRVLERAVPRGPWLHFYRGVLSGPKGLAHFAKLAAYPARRYGWMFHKAGATALAAAEFETAARWLKRSLAGRPADWRARGFLAEARLCLGQTKEAFAEMDRALRQSPPEDRGDVLAWRGELDLWLGNYRKALAGLAEAEALGARGAYGWRGAALLKLGRRREALARLDATLAMNPLDFEALVWRGEVKRELGRHREALRDLERVPESIRLWALINRVLCKSSLGEEKGANADFRSLPPAFLDALRAKTGLEKRDDLMKAALSLARGFRRDEYRQAIWLR